MNIEASITGISYKYYMCRDLREYSEHQIVNGMPKDATFFLNIDGEKVALSYWVSPKRTRSYPYTRVYDSLNFSGKKITVIPIMKDEGFSGDRDFIQWDTVSLMSLLGVYVVIAYYKDASSSSRYEDKITDQTFDMDYVIGAVREILRYQSDALHWNLTQIDKLQEIGNRAISAYNRIFESYGQRMHRIEGAMERIHRVMIDRDNFMNFSRNLAREAQSREVRTTQLRESIESGSKARITIRNYLGGEYYFTADEARIFEGSIYLIEAKNSTRECLPSITDIKDGLFKMVLFSNLSNVGVNGIKYPKQAVLKLTGVCKELSATDMTLLERVKREALENGFRVIVNDKWLV